MECSSVDPVIQQIVDKGKRGAAEYIKTCRSPELINLLLDRILSHEASINDNESIDWIKWLMAGGETPNDFTTIVKKYNNATTCGLVWTAQFVAYRCRTCGISPCMSLCADCFLGGKHEGHDFNMFRSQAGGACDCGDTSVMRPSGFCDKHGIADNSESMIPPPDLLYVAEIMIPRIFFRLILHLRNFKRTGTSGTELRAFDAEEFLTMLSDFSAMGAAMRRVLTSALISPQVYRKVTQEWSPYDPSFTAFMSTCNSLYEEALESLQNPTPDEFIDCPGLQKDLVHKTFLEELVFWTVKYEFPQKVVCFLLNMLPDVKYKEALTEAFIVHYSRIAMVLEKASDPDTLSNRVVHVSVQLFSNEELAVRMTENFSLLQVMVVSLKNMMKRILTPLPLCSPSRKAALSRPFVVNCSLNVMNQHCYWPLVSDLNNVLSHRPVAIKFMENDTLTKMWFSFLSYFQGMNVNQRELNQHVEFEPSTYYAAFSAELEASAYPMWALLSHLNSKSTIPYTKRMLRSCLMALETWLNAVFDSDYMKDPQLLLHNPLEDNQVSFHIPLHRYLATFVCQAVNVQQLPLEDVLPQRSLILPILLHPLRIQVAFYEIVNGLWVRNGLQIKGQAMTYIQCNFCSSMVDADLYLLQILATQLLATNFMEIAIKKFRISDWLSFFNSTDRSIAANDSDNEAPMVESFLQFLATLCCNRTNLGIEYYGSGPTYPLLTRLEMITLLCVSDRTHSQLMELMPERCGTSQSRDFDVILKQVADFKPPVSEFGGNMQQGMYFPKACVWEELYDPIHVLLRAVQNKKDFQNSTDRFTAYVKENKLLPHGKVPWPPFRIPRPCNAAYKDPRHILNTSLFHSVVWIVFYKYVHEGNVSEHVLSLAVYLLEMALSVVQPLPTSQISNEELPKVDVVNLELASWFPHDHIAINVRTTIKTIVMPQPEYQLNSESSAVFKWKSMPECGDLYPAGRPPVRHMLETRSFSHDYDSGLTPSSSTTLLPPHATDPSLLPASAHRYEIPSALDVRRITMLPRKACSHSRRSSSVAWSGSTAPSSADMKIFDANESIISLLLRIHSKLSGCHDSFNPDTIQSEELDVRIGDGPAFVAKVLTRIMMLDEVCRAEVIACRGRLWKKQQFKVDQDQKDAENNKLSDKKRRAMERQRKIMESFVFQQEEFAKNNLDVNCDDKMDWEGSDTSHSQTQVTQKQYDCGICSQTSPSTDENPIGLVILVQATSVLGHKRRNPEKAILPISDKDRAILMDADSLAADFDKKFKELTNEFKQLSWQQSISFGWEGGVHVQTCGHHLHQECLMRYLTSLRGQQRLPSDRGEYLCPMCRQLANSVLPVPPDCSTSSVVCGRQQNLSKAVSDIANLLHSVGPERKEEKKSALTMTVEKSLDDMKISAYPKYLQRCDFVDIFSTWVARTNLEIEVVQRGGSLLKPVVSSSTSSSLLPSSSRESLSSIIAKKSSCILPLLHVLTTHAHSLDNIPAWIAWQQLTGTIFIEHASPLKDKSKIVPLLLRDPIAMLIHFVLILPLNMDQTYFTCIVKFLYNLLYFQVVAQLSFHLTEGERNFFRMSSRESNENLRQRFSLDHAMKYAIESIDKVQLYIGDGNQTGVQEEPAYETLELQIQEMCLPFLRVASVLRHHMYNEELPEVLVAADEFVRLVYYLELVSHGMDRAKFNSSVMFSRKDDKMDFVTYWFEQFLTYAKDSQPPARDFLIGLHIPWKQPKLLDLPEEYDQIFLYYQSKACSYCHLTPKDGSICLVCGTLVCFKAECCKRNKVYEATQHANNCGAGTGMFLVVTSSCVIVIRGKRACVWGSVYLDQFGEEDSDRKRGKPLFLSKERYSILERQWLTHSFDHTNKKWLPHADGL